MAIVFRDDPTYLLGIFCQAATIHLKICDPKSNFNTVSMSMRSFIRKLDKKNGRLCQEESKRDSEDLGEIWGQRD